MATRRSTRERRKPMLYEVEDRRLSAIGSGKAEDQEPHLEHEESEDDSGEEEEGSEEEEEAAPRAKPKTRHAKPQKKRAVSKPTESKPRQSKRHRSASNVDSNGKDADSASQDGDAAKVDEEGKEEQDDDVLFDAILEGKGSIKSLVMEWRDRFDEDEDASTRELLNFALQACGASDSIVHASTELDGMDIGALVEEVVQHLAETHGSYPIAPRTKGSKRFHRSFVEFWQLLVAECHESEVLFSSNVVGRFIEWFTTMSSAEVRAIRHTATIAVYSLAHGLSESAAALSQQLSVVNRQLSARNGDRATPTRRSPNSKREALLKENKALFETRLEQVLANVDSIFNGVFVHRYRDVMLEIRAESVLALGQWITALSDQYLKDQFLKYLGWLLNDKSALVRYQVVDVLRGLYDEESFASKLELFTSRFLPRFLQLCDDVDDDVVEAAIRLLIAVDKRSLISSGVDLQSVEKLVFDAEHPDIRKIAAEFVCLQYDAFGVALKADAKLNKEQLNTQAIALVEFAEEYITNHGVPLEAVTTLVDAFWEQEDCLVLRDWKLLTNLLLMDKSSPDVSAEQQSILLAILIASIRKIIGEEDDQAPDKKSIAQERDEITVTFCREIPSLLTAFQSDSDKLSLLTQLIPLMSLGGEVAGQQVGQITEIAEKMKHAYMLHADESMLATFAVSFSYLLQAEYETIKREVAVVVVELIQSVLERLNQQLKDDQDIYEKLLATSASESSQTKAKSKKKKNSKKARAHSKEAADAEYGLRVSLSRLSCLISYVNVGEFLPSTVAAHANASDDTDGDHAIAEGGGDSSAAARLGAVIATILNLIERRTRGILLLDDEFRNPDTIRLSLMVVYHHLLWLAAPIVARSDESVDMSDEHSDRLRADLEHVVRARINLEDALMFILDMHLEKSSRESLSQGNDQPQPTMEIKEIEFEDDEVRLFVRTVQHLAFITFCDARCLFVEKMRDFVPPYDVLQWQVPKTLVLLTQMHFENEMETSLAPPPEEEDEAEDLAAAEERQAQRDAWEADRKKKAELLAALGRVALCNPSSKRQAAAILGHFTTDDKMTLDVIKEFSKQVKADAPVRYLEIQMTSLRRVFSSLLSWKEELVALDASSAKDPKASKEDSELREELLETIESTNAELHELSKKFSRSLGVGKVAAALRAPFLRFLCEGVRYSLEAKSHFSFLEAIQPYLSHLDRSSCNQLHAYFTQTLAGVEEDIPESEDNVDESWQSVVKFRSAISHGVRKSARETRSSATGQSVSSAPPASIAEEEATHKAEGSNTEVTSVQDQSNRSPPVVPSSVSVQDKDDAGEEEVASDMQRSSPLKRPADPSEDVRHSEAHAEATAGENADAELTNSGADKDQGSMRTSQSKRRRRS